MHYRQMGYAKSVVNYKMSKLLKPAFAAQIQWQCSKMGALQPRAEGIPHSGISSSHNGISGSHKRTGSARGWPSFGISGNVAPYLDKAKLFGFLLGLLGCQYGILLLSLLWRTEWNEQDLTGLLGGL
jgi:hypothetical protein